MDYDALIAEKEDDLANTRGMIAAHKHELRTAYKRENEIQGAIKMLKRLRATQLETEIDLGGE